MAREKEMFREQLAVINEHFGGKPMLTAIEIARWMKIDRRTVVKTFSIKDNRISAVQLAKEMLP